jgi:hypothetical protein
VFAAGVLLFSGSASAQFTGQVKVSNAIEGSGKRPGVSAARCGYDIVVGFEDAEPSNPGSTAGFSVSKDNGKTFSDLGVLADPAISFGGGDSPVIACSSSNLFYYATIRNFGDFAACFVGCSEVALSISTNGGSKWNAPVVASSVTEDIYDLQSPSFAVDPTNPNRLYAAYINNNFNGPNDYPGCDDANEFILEVVTSGDGGKTWDSRVFPGSERGSPNIQPDHTCTGFGFDARHTGSLASPSVVVSPTGVAYVVYEFVGASANLVPAAPNEIRFTRSTDHGATFSAPLTVSADAINNALPQIAVNSTHSPRRGEIFVTWPGSPTKTYTDVLVSDSLDGGTSFSFPRPISPTPTAGAGRFQSNPVIAVDNDGQVAACFYDTPTNSPTSSSVYSYNCATSFNNAATWQVGRVMNSAPVGFDAATSDFLTHHDGFFTAFELQANGVRHVAGEFADIN